MLPIECGVDCFGISALPKGAELHKGQRNWLQSENMYGCQQEAHFHAIAPSSLFGSGVVQQLADCRVANGTLLLRMAASKPRAKAERVVWLGLLTIRNTAATAH